MTAMVPTTWALAADHAAPARSRAFAGPDPVAIDVVMTDASTLAATTRR